MPKAVQAAPEGDDAALDMPEITFKGLGLGARTEKALEDMALRGLSYPQAAIKRNMRPDSLLRAFNRPHVRKVFNQAVKSIRDNAAVSAYLRNVELSQTAQSEAVRADLNKWVAGVDGIAALKRVEGRIAHSHTFSGFGFAEYGKDVTPPDDASGDDD